MAGTTTGGANAYPSKSFSEYEYQRSKAVEEYQKQWADWGEKFNQAIAGAQAVPIETFHSIPPAYVLLLYSGSNYKKLFCKDSQEALEKVREFQQDPAVSQIMLFELQDVWARKWEKEKR